MNLFPYDFRIYYKRNKIKKKRVIDMRKVFIVLAVFLLLTSCSVQQSNSIQDKAKESYNIMITAANEHRYLTANEEKTVQSFDRSLENKDKLSNAIHAMYFNFYETGYGDSEHFNYAKKLAEKYLK
jgi:competence protein ComGC